MLIEEVGPALPPFVQRTLLTPDECLRLRTEMRSQPTLTPGLVGTGIAGQCVKDPSRICNTFELEGEQYEWLYQRLGPALREINELYQFDLYGMLYNLTFMQYKAHHAEFEDDHGRFDWHSDCGGNLSALRKLSVSIALSDPADYQGGHLQLFCRGALDLGQLPLGSVTVFPSYMQHCVTDVTVGERCVLVAFVLGPRFR